MFDDDVCPCLLQTRCKSMIDAFAAGGDFHSRTAMGMYPHVAEAVGKGEVLLELDDNPNRSGPKPLLLKNVFSSERRKAKVCVCVCLRVRALVWLCAFASVCVSTVALLWCRS